jgi:hypothetical protein
LNFEALSVIAGQEKWVEKAVSIFNQYRVLIIKGLFRTQVTAQVLKSLQELHTSWSAKCDPGRLGNRQSGRYEMMDAFDTWHLTHLPGYLEALEEFASNGGLELLEGLGDNYKFVGGHAHLCLAGTHNWQALHSDFTHPNFHETKPLWDDPAHVAFMDLLFTLHPLTSDNAPLRLIPGQPSTDKTYHQFPPSGEGFPPPSLECEPDVFKRAKLFPLPAGCGILRDLRIWHGGTPNTSSEDRYTAVLRFYSAWSLRLWKDCLYELPGAHIEDVQRKLSQETQNVVCPHIIRNEGDPEPQLQDKVGWSSAKDHWSANNYQKPYGDMN